MDDHSYDDIINLPRHVSRNYLPMPMRKRAAQFAPFAALSGYAELIRETARVTEPKEIPDEQKQELLNRTLSRLLAQIQEGKTPEIMVKYFVPDPRKEGGAYLRKQGCLKKIFLHEGCMVLQDGTKIPLPDVSEIETLGEDPDFF